MQAGLVAINSSYNLIPERLNPADQFTLMMDHEIRKSGLAGNYCALILELDSVADAQLIADQCNRFSQSFPAATARLIQTGRHYAWQSNPDAKIPFHEHHLEQLYDHDEFQDAALDVVGLSAYVTKILNQSSPSSQTAPIELHLITSTSTCQLVLRWFHPVCDAKGAELILHHLFQANDTDNQQTRNQQSQAAISQLMNKWSLWEKLKLVLKSKKNIKQLDKFSSILPVQSTADANQVKTKVMQFNHHDSERILTLARQYAGLSGITLYFIGCMIRALEQTGSKRSGDAYCVPYAMNLRKRKSLFPVFGNQVSFLFAQAQRELLVSRTDLFNHLREQNKLAIKHGLDRAMLPLMLAGSWLDLEKYAQLVRYSPKGKERSSFWFSYTGSMDPQTRQIGDSNIVGMYQFCQLTSPPSLGLLVNNFDNKITLSYNYIDNQFDADWLLQLIDNMSSELLERE